MSKKANSLLFVFAGILISLQPLVPLIQKVSAAELVDQSIEVCFVGLDSEGKVISSIEGNTSISLDLYTEGVHLEENKVNSYGSGKINLSGTNAISPNTKLNTDNGLIDAYCTTKTFKSAPNHEYTYSRAVITSDLDWKEIRYNDEVSIDFVDPDIAFPYSGEWFDDVVGNENLRERNSDGHIVMNAERPNRRLVVVAQLGENLPDYGVIFRDSAPTSLEYTLSTLPNKLQPNSTVNLRFTVINTGKLTWLSALSGVSNPVNVSYHWKNVDTGEYYQYEGNRALLSQPEVKPTFNDSNIALTLNTPTQPGNYQLILDLVHEGITWFSQAGADTKTFNIQVGEPLLQRGLTNDSEMQLVSAQAAGGFYYIVQPARPWDTSWRCWGYDCYSGIAEEFYHCSTLGIPNNAPSTSPISVLQQQCWWPIYAANTGLYAGMNLTYPWEFLLVGWQLFIPGSPWSGNSGPVPSNNFTGGVLGSTPVDPYAGMNGANQPWPQITFDRFISWDGSYKVDQIKWTNQETVRPNAPTITAMSTNAATNSVTIYGVAIPKGHPMHIRVWNEYRYCWACGSGWDFHYQQGSAQHVKVVLFKEGWQYLGELWNDRSDGRWSITLPLGANLNTGDKVFAEVQIEADYTFNNLRWWSNTYETVNFNVRNPKYFGWPYFASGGSLPVTVPKVIVDNRSDVERAIDDRAGWLNATGAKDFTHICNVPAKEFTNLKNGQPGAIFYINNRTVYSWGGTWDTFMWYGDRCQRFGAPINDPVDPAGVGPYNTSGAFQDFQNGRIYWSWKYAGKFLYGTIWNIFEQAGGTNSRYGWPTSEAYIVDEEGRSFRCQNFEGGSLCEIDIQEIVQNPSSNFIVTLSSIDRELEWLSIGDLRDQRAGLVSIYYDRGTSTTKVGVNEIDEMLSYVKSNYSTVISNKQKRQFINAIYISLLRAKRHYMSSISFDDLDVLVEGTKFIASSSVSNSIDDFEEDLTLVFSSRRGKQSVVDQSGGLSDDERETFYIGQLGDTGFSNIYRDSKYYKYDSRYIQSNQIFHLIGGGFNFAYSGDSHCVFIVCYSSDGWMVWHETAQKSLRSPSSVGDYGTSWEDLFLSKKGLELGYGLRNGQISPMSLALSFAQLSKQEDYCSLLGGLPSSSEWDISCSLVNNDRIIGYTNSQTNPKE